MLLILRFFTKNGPFFTWLVLAIISIVLLCQSDPYHRSVWFGGANVVSGGVFTVSDGISGYFNLRTVNQELLDRLAMVEEENCKLKAELRLMADVDSVLHSSRPYKYQIAHVVNNSITQAENYLILDKGDSDSIHVGMAVADQNGVIGLVSKVSSHFSQVISVLNPKLQLSACLKNSDAAGSLVWTGESPLLARLENLPRNVPYEIGDTVITSGLGGSFPRGILVGKIVEVSPSKNNNFLSFQIELFTHFDRINDVYVIQNTQPCPF